MTLDTQEVPDLFNSSRDDEIGFSKTGFTEEFPDGIKSGVDSISIIWAIAVG
jgi:hypothetical protein|tara:strand:- start:718 stop:873 length:156 start_codon:yes stop_codon:yes gene_type:complete